jgi:hypothetical protein
MLIIKNKLLTFIPYYISQIIFKRQNITQGNNNYYIDPLWGIYKKVDDKSMEWLHNQTLLYLKSKNNKILELLYTARISERINKLKSYEKLLIAQTNICYFISQRIKNHNTNILRQLLIYIHDETIDQILNEYKKLLTNVLSKNLSEIDNNDLKFALLIYYREIIIKELVYLDSIENMKPIKNIYI